MRVTVKGQVGRSRFDFVFHLAEDERTTGDIETKLAAALLERNIDLGKLTDWRITRIEGGELSD